jgi:hypothetical protein
MGNEHDQPNRALPAVARWRTDRSTSHSAGRLPRPARRGADALRFSRNPFAVHIPRPQSLVAAAILLISCVASRDGCCSCEPSDIAAMVYTLLAGKIRQAYRPSNIWRSFCCLRRRIGPVHLFGRSHEKCCNCWPVVVVGSGACSPRCLAAIRGSTVGRKLDWSRSRGRRRFSHCDSLIKSANICTSQWIEWPRLRRPRPIRLCRSIATFRLWN